MENKVLYSVSGAALGGSLALFTKEHKLIVGVLGAAVFGGIGYYIGNLQDNALILPTPNSEGVPNKTPTTNPIPSEPPAPEYTETDFTKFLNTYFLYDDVGNKISYSIDTSIGAKSFANWFTNAPFNQIINPNYNPTADQTIRNSGFGSGNTVMIPKLVIDPSNKPQIKAAFDEHWQNYYTYLGTLGITPDELSNRNNFIHQLYNNNLSFTTKKGQDVYWKFIKGVFKVSQIKSLNLMQCVFYGSVAYVPLYDPIYTNQLSNIKITDYTWQHYMDYLNANFLLPNKSTSPQPNTFVSNKKTLSTAQVQTIHPSLHV